MMIKTQFIGTTSKDLEPKDFKVVPEFDIKEKIIRDEKESAKTSIQTLEIGNQIQSTSIR